MQLADGGTANVVKKQAFTRCDAIPGAVTCDSTHSWCGSWRHHGSEQTDVVAVLDVSKRMQGEWLERMKQAMMMVIDELGANDRLSIVSFGTCERRLMELTYMSGHGQVVARLKINELVAAGEADDTGHMAGAALRQGAQVLSLRGAKEGRSRAGCMMFLSDARYPKKFQTDISSRFPVHTFGLGTDHDPDVMKYIANLTSGTYSSVSQDMENFKCALALFFTSLTSPPAMSIKITLEANEGITISSIKSNGSHIHQVKLDGRSGVIVIDDIYGNKQRNDFIVCLKGKKEMSISGWYLSHDTRKHLPDTYISVVRPHQGCVPSGLDIHLFDTSKHFELN